MKCEQWQDVGKLQRLLLELETLTLENNIEGMRETEHKIISMYIAKEE